MKHPIALLPLLCAISLALSGCQDTFTTIDGNKTWDSLSEDEREQLSCEDAKSYLDDRVSEAEFRRAICWGSAYGQGVAAFVPEQDEAAAAEACQDALEECLADSEEGEIECNVNYNPSCTFTVDEFQACIEESTATLKELAAFSCEAADWAEEPDFPSQAACETVFGSCPEDP